MIFTEKPKRNDFQIPEFCLWQIPNYISPKELRTAFLGSFKLHYISCLCDRVLLHDGVELRLVLCWVVNGEICGGWKFAEVKESQKALKQSTDEPKNSENGSQGKPGPLFHKPRERSYAKQARPVPAAQRD